MTFQPAPSDEGRRGLIATAVLALVEIILVFLGFSLTVGAAPFLILMLALILSAPLVYVAWRTWLCLSLEYWLDRNGVTIAWGPWRQVIPIGQIERIQRGVQAPALAHWADRWPRLRPWLEYGPDLDRTWQDAGRAVVSVASQPPAEQLLLVTPETAFGISPADPDAFLRELEAHHQLGPTRLRRLERQSPALFRLPLWRDRLALGLLAAGFLGWLLLLGISMTRFPRLPLALESLGGVDRRLIFLLPGFALAVWLLNGAWGLLVYQGQRVASLLLWTGTLVVQAVTLVALLSLTVF